MWFIWALDVAAPWPTETTDVPYNGQTLNLMPQTDQNFASIAIQTSIGASDASEAVHRFLSVLSWVDGMGIRTLWNVGNPGWRQPTPRSPFFTRPATPLARANFDFLPVPKTRQAAKALAFYREAVSTTSKDNQFLQYFRILELAHGHNNAEHPKFMNELVEKAQLQGDARDALQTLRSRGVNVGKQIVISGRHAVAHGDDSIAIDPDVISQRTPLHESMPIVAALAIHTIESHFGVPTKQSYYRRHEYEVDGFAALLAPATREQILKSGGALPLAVDLPVEEVTIGLRNSRYPALTDLVISNAIIEDGGVTLWARSKDGLVLVLVRFDLLNHRLLFDLQAGVGVQDNGSPESAEHGADILELALGLVHNGELHVWDSKSDDLLGRQNPNLPVNIDPAATRALLVERIEALRDQARVRRKSGDDGT
jgi:hypothetical protein